MSQHVCVQNSRKDRIKDELREDQHDDKYKRDSTITVGKKG